MPTVLIVDDDDDARTLLTLLLELDGHTVRTANDGVEALEVLQGGLRPCLIVLDLMMPRLDGEGVVRALRNDPALAALPVVVVSGVADLDSAAGRLDVSALLTKPVEPDVLLDMVRNYCHA